MSEPLRVLVLHNAYQLAGGEDAVVAAEVALLREHGHAVALLTRHNSELARLSRVDAALQALWSRDSARRTAEAIAQHRPQIVHVHNTWPLLSPSVYGACRRAGVPVVQTLHNFRLACPQAMFLRDGRVCTDCLGRPCNMRVIEIHARRRPCSPPPWCCTAAWAPGSVACSATSH